MPSPWPVDVFGIFKRRRRKRILSEPWPQAWDTHAGERVRLWRFLDDETRGRVRPIAQILIAEKDWYARGLELTDEMRVVVAVQAALLLLGLRHDYYRGLRSIILYPTGYEITQTESAGGGFELESEMAVVGEAHQSGGPVVLSWKEVIASSRNSDGRNVVLHEFAHKLDLRDGYADGTPVLASPTDYARWSRVMSEQYLELVEDVERGRRTLLDDYGATNEAEFFAVITETFFEEPRELSAHHGELYETLRDYYGQDPCKWELR